jgi:hypothetical protein
LKKNYYIKKTAGASKTNKTISGEFQGSLHAAADDDDEFAGTVSPDQN